MAEELKYTSEYDGATTDDLLGYAKEAKELKSNEYVRSMKEQLAAEDAETVQVYDVEGVPHKIFKKELISKAGIQLPSLEEIGGFVAYDTNGQALGLMSKEQVAQVVGGLLSALIPKGYAKGDANLILLPGIYDFHKDDYPFSNIPLNFGTLIVYSGNSDRHFITQIASSISSSEVYSRTSTEGGESWGPWLKLN